METFQSPTTDRMARVDDGEALESFDPELEAQLEDEEEAQRAEAARLKLQAEAAERRLQEQDEVLEAIQRIQRANERLQQTERLQAEAVMEHVLGLLDAVNDDAL